MNGLTARHLHDIPATDRDGLWPHELWAGALACRECALRVLVLLLNSPQWVGRRVERVAFHDDRTAVRRVSMDFLLPAASPRYRVGDGRVVCLVPLTVMRRKTLVNFGLTDVDGRALSLMGMRHTQALTKQIVLALAEITPDVEVSSEVDTFAEALAFGTQQDLKKAFTKAQSGHSGTDLERLLRERGAGQLLRRLANNFLLLVTVDETGPPHRIIRFFYDEPLTLTYKVSRSGTTKKTDVDEERPLPVWPRRLGATFGWSPTVIIFPIPAAENTLSYHFEIEAPAGVMIDSASLVAGRPNEAAPELELSWDHVAGGFPVVGLHAYKVPNGSLSQAQVKLRLNRRGWLSASLLASLLSAALLWCTALATLEEASTVATSLLTITAAVIAFVVKPAEHQMASRLVTSVRAAATISMFLLVAVGALITFATKPSPLLLKAAAGTASGCCLLVGLAWWRAQPSDVEISPWEQGLEVEEPHPSTRTDFTTVEDARQYFGFDRAAVEVASSEGDHREAFEWTNDVEKAMNQRLLTALRTPRAARRPGQSCLGQPYSDAAAGTAIAADER